MNTVRTVSDTKRAFYSLHTRPINSVYRRVVEELMVEMHLLSVNADFRYDPIYALGVVTTFDRFMAGYRPEQDKASIFFAICQANQADPQRYRQDAEQLLGKVSGITSGGLADWLQRSSQGAPSGDPLEQTIKNVASNSKFKYSRLFAIGLFTLIESAEPEAVKDANKLQDVLDRICPMLNISSEKVQKDLELYRSNLDKLTQAQIVLDDIMKAEQKRREQRAKDKTNSTTPDLSTNEAPSGS